MSLAEPGGHDLSAGGDVLDRVTECAREALACYGVRPEAVSPGAELSLLNVSENATFRVTDPDGRRSILRVHRLGYHSEAAIESELAWMDALRAEAGIRTPRVLPATDGRRVVSAAGRHCVRFEFLPGSEPAGADGGPRALAHFAELGAITARMHAHARNWARPGWFTRFRWDDDDAFGAEHLIPRPPPQAPTSIPRPPPQAPASIPRPPPQAPAPRGRTGRWGRWRDGVGVGPAEAEILGQLERRLRERLARYGAGPDKFGLIHADTRLANLLVHEGTTAVIDFDDAGFGWYLYDLGTTVSFFEDDIAVPGLIAAWLAGYREAGGVLGPQDIAETWTFILFRRLLLTAWIGSHPAAAEAAEPGEPYTRGSCDLAEQYLSGRLTTRGF
ncbi:MAG TPA: phosphotransferase [Trebonia sp.]|nr:phosphotransferase [Trebonia sp.]